MAYDHRFVPPPTPDADLDRLSIHAIGWLGFKVSSTDSTERARWGSYATLGARLEPPAPGRIGVVPMLRVGHSLSYARPQDMWLEQWIFEQNYGLSAGLVFGARGQIAAGRVGAHYRVGMFAFELVTELDTARRAPRWIFSGGIGF